MLRTSWVGRALDIGAFNIVVTSIGQEGHALTGQRSLLQSTWDTLALVDKYLVRALAVALNL